MSGLCWNVLSNYVNAGARDLMYSAPGPGLTACSVTGRAGWCINTSTHQDGAAPLLISLTAFLRLWSVYVT